MQSNMILSSAEELLKLVNELRLARLTMDWSKQDKLMTEQVQKFEARESGDRASLKRVYEEIKNTIEKIEKHRNTSRAKMPRMIL